MSLDGKLLSKAKTRLDKRRTENEEAFSRRRGEAYSRNPRIREIDARLRGTMIETIGIALKKGQDPEEALSKIRDENLSLQEERALALSAIGLPADHLNEKYICPVCRDTGYNGTEICSCLMELYRDEQRKELSELLKLGEETFDNFDLTLYSEAPDPETGISPRRSMEVVYETCMEYARKFSKDSINLFLSGSTGLGKTFLSTCIAKVVSEKGFSVVYDTAASVFAKYEAEKFGKNADMSQSRSEIARLESCDLLIVDDLGTEFQTAFVTSALYTLINTRLTTCKKTIISSNLSMKELSARYSAPIMSRLQGEFHVLKFYGKDIRLLKKYR